MISLLINFARKGNKLIKVARLLDYPLMMLCHREIFGFFFRAVYRTVACIIFPSSKFEDRLNLKVLVLINDMKKKPFSCATGRCACFSFSITYFHTACERLFMLFEAEEHERIERESRLVGIAIIINRHKSVFLNKILEQKSL